MLTLIDTNSQRAEITNLRPELMNHKTSIMYQALIEWGFQNRAALLSAMSRASVGTHSLSKPTCLIERKPNCYRARTWPDWRTSDTRDVPDNVPFPATSHPRDPIAETPRPVSRARDCRRGRNLSTASTMTVSCGKLCNLFSCSASGCNSFPISGWIRRKSFYFQFQVWKSLSS